MVCECVNDETMVVETCDLMTRCVLHGGRVVGNWWLDGWGCGEDSRGQVEKIIESIMFSI